MRERSPGRDRTPGNRGAPLPQPLSRLRNGANLSVMMANSLPLEGEGWGGDGLSVAKEPIPILAFPLKGKGR